VKNIKNIKRRKTKVFWWRFKPYLKIARLDHWFKNVFMLFGVLLAFFIYSDVVSLYTFPKLLLAFLIVGMIASSNYVLNEILDAPKDRFHPQKKNRPIPSGKININIAYLQWSILGILGMGLGFWINAGFGFSGMALWIMGILYNVSPFRTKEIPYLDVISESANNPLRLLLGWFVVVSNAIPPISLLIAYWMLGAFFMAMKRFAELRSIGDQKRAIKYRKSFAHYNLDRLLLSLFFYAIVGSLFSGVFIVRYHLELILFLPFAAGFLTYYFKLGLHAESPVQAPEKLYRERSFFVYALVSLVLFVFLMFVKIPILYKWFNVQESTVKPLWTLGGSFFLAGREIIFKTDSRRGRRTYF